MPSPASPSRRSPHVAVAGERAVYLTLRLRGPRLGRDRPRRRCTAIAGSPDRFAVGHGLIRSRSSIPRASRRRRSLLLRPRSPTGSTTRNEDGPQPPRLGRRTDPDVADLFDSDDSTPERSATETGAESDASAPRWNRHEQVPRALPGLKAISPPPPGTSILKGCTARSDLTCGRHPRRASRPTPRRHEQSLTARPVSSARRSEQALNSVRRSPDRHYQRGRRSDLGAVGAPGHNNEAGAFAVVRWDRHCHRPDSPRHPLRVHERIGETGLAILPQPPVMDGSARHSRGSTASGALSSSVAPIRRAPWCARDSPRKAFTQDFNAG